MIWLCAIVGDTPTTMTLLHDISLLNVSMYNSIVKDMQVRTTGCKHLKEVRHAMTPSLSKLCCTIVTIARVCKRARARQ